MPMDMSKYPPNWKEISMFIRASAEWRCEFCGAEHRKPHPETGSTVILTVAHLDHDTTNNTRANLRALCQRCHLTHDAQYHARNAAAAARRSRARVTRRRRLVEAGQLSFVQEA